MSKQSLALRTTNVTIANPCLEIIASATEKLRISEINIFMAGPAGGTFGIGFPAAIGITPTTPVTFLSHDAADNAPTATAALAWGTAPTVPANFLYRVTFAAATGGFVSISIPEGIIIPISKSLVVWNITTVDVADITVINSTKPLAQVLANF